MLKLHKPWRNITGLSVETEGMCVSWNGYPNVTISTAGEPKHIGETLVFFNEKSCLQMHTNSFIRIWANDLSILDNLAPRIGESV